VLLDRRPEESAGRHACDLVGIDNHRAGYIATEHLLRLGVRRAGFVRVEGQATTVRARVRGFQDAVHEFDAAGHVFTMPAGERFPLPAAARECEAFVCANDRVAAHVMQTLLAAGLRIPRDVRIVGIDDVNYAALLPVPLTTVHQPCRDIGEAAAAALLKLDFTGHQTRELLGQRDLSYGEVATIIGKAIKRPNLNYTQLPDEHMKPVLMQLGMSTGVADLILEMCGSLNSGHMRPLEPRAPKNTTPTSYEDFVTKIFVPVYQGKTHAA